MKSQDFSKIEISPDLHREINLISTTTCEREDLLKVLSETPRIFKELSLENFPVYLPRRKMSLCLFSKDSYNHGHQDEIGRSTISYILSQFSNPLLVTREDEVYGFYFKNKEQNSCPFYVPVRLSKDSKRYIILSLYTKILTNKEEVLYVDDTEFNRRWTVKSYRLLRFKGRVEDLIFLGEVKLKTKLLKQG